jgi:hypothetical protein
VLKISNLSNIYLCKLIFACQLMEYAFGQKSVRKKKWKNGKINFNHARNKRAYEVNGQCFLGMVMQYNE